MLTIILHRMVATAILIVVVPLLTLLMLETIPGGYCSSILPEHASIKTIQSCEKNINLPVWHKYVSTLNGLVHFDLGRSLSSSKRPIVIEIQEQLAHTLRLGLVSFTVSLSIGIWGGIVLAQQRQSFSGQLLNWVGISIISLPSFVFALILMKIFALRLGWVSILGDASNWRMMILPVLSISVPLGTWFARITRNSIVDVLNRDYVRTASAKGLADHAIYMSHAFRNALATIIPLGGLIFAGLLDGSLLIEIIFSRPGLGRYTLHAVLTHDYPALQGVILLVLLTTIFANLLADLMYYSLFPQSRG